MAGPSFKCFERVTAVAVVTLAVLSGAGCGSDAEPQPSTAPELGAELPVSAGNSYGPVYETVEEVAAASELVVTGEVTSQVSVGTPDEEDDPNASEYFRLTTKVERTLKGTPASSGEVSFAWEGFITEVTKDGTRARLFRVVTDGVSMPDVGDRLLLFLSPQTPEASAFYGGGISHDWISVLWIEDNGRLLTEIEGDWHPARTLIGQTVDEVAKLLEDA